MSCDICGRQINGKPNRIVVEGARMMACGECASLGTPYREPRAVSRAASIPALRPMPVVAPRPVPTHHVPPRPIRPRPAEGRARREVQELDVADNYPQIVQKARRKHELTQEALAMKAKERLSVIQKIELGKMVPDMRLARTLEHVLRVKLLVPRTELPVPKLSATPAKRVTLADVAKIRKKDDRDTLQPQARGGL